MIKEVNELKTDTVKQQVPDNAKKGEAKQKIKEALNEENELVSEQTPKK